MQVNSGDDSELNELLLVHNTKACHNHISYKIHVLCVCVQTCVSADTHVCRRVCAGVRVCVQAFVCRRVCAGVCVQACVCASNLCIFYIIYICVYLDMCTLNLYIHTYITVDRSRWRWHRWVFSQCSTLYRWPYRSLIWRWLGLSFWGFSETLRH